MTEVLFVVPKLGVGGVERSLVNLLNLMPKEGLNVTLLTFLPGGELMAELPNNVSVCCDRRVGRIEAIRAALSGILQESGVEKCFIAAKKIYHRFGRKFLRKSTVTKTFDVAIAYADGLATWYVATKVNADKKLAFAHTDFLRAGYDAVHEKTVYRSFKKIYFGSQAARESFLTLLPEFAGRTDFLPNGINVERIIRLSEKPAFFWPKRDKVNLLTVGRLSAEKGVKKIPYILRGLKDAGILVRWLLVGDGKERDNVRRLAQRLEVDDELVLLGSQANPYPYMKSCDIYVQPSEYEGYCIALAEARALNKPIVTCSFAGANEQLKDGYNGFITGYEVDDICEALAKLICDSEMQKVFSERLRQSSSFEGDTELICAWWEGIKRGAE